MKSILKIGMVIAVVATVSTARASVTGDNIFLSTSQTNPSDYNAGTGITAVSYSSTGVKTLYIWVTSATESDAITPANTGYSGNGTALGAAAIAVNGALTGPGIALTGASMTQQAFGGAGAGANRWSAVSSFTTGVTSTTNITATNFYNLEANGAPPTPQGGFPSGTHMGLSTLNTATIDPLYFPAVTVGSVTGAWRVGQVTVNVTAAGAQALALSASNQAANVPSNIPAGLFITKSPVTGNPNNVQDLTSFYNYGTANITTSLGRIGDINGDGNVNAADIDLMSAKLLAGGLPYSLLYDYRGPGGPNSGPDGIIDQANDKARLVGSLIDINLNPVSVGTHNGDADLNGTVNANDYVLLSGHLGQAGGWAAGDFTGDGVVNANDYVLLSGNLGLSGGTGQIAAVPEPATLVLCGIGIIGLLGVRRRNACR